VKIYLSPGLGERASVDELPRRRKTPPLPLFFFIMAAVSYSFLAVAYGGEVGGQIPSAATASGSPSSLPSFHAIPPEELAEWRINQAEIRALQAEMALAVRERNDKLQALTDLWKTRYGIDDLSQWAVDLENGGRIVRNERAQTR